MRYTLGGPAAGLWRKTQALRNVVVIRAMFHRISSICLPALLATSLLAAACSEDQKSAPSASKGPAAQASASAQVAPGTKLAKSANSADNAIDSGSLPSSTGEAPIAQVSATVASAKKPPQAAPKATAKVTAKTPKTAVKTVVTPPKTPVTAPPKTLPKTPPKTPPKATAAKTASAPPPAAEPKLSAPKPGSADAVALKIDGIFSPVKRFRARFIQKYTAKIHGTTKKSQGILYVLKPSKLSLSYQKPNRNRAVSNGATLKVYEHDNKQMFVRKVKNTEYPGAFAFILGKGLRKSFSFAFHKGSKWEGGPVLVGTPRTPNAGYKKVLFYIDRELLARGDLGAVRRVLVVDAQGNKNRFDFVHAEEPATIRASEFNFEPPVGTEIIKG